MIAIGGTVFLSIENKVIGASLFSIGLFGVLIYNLNLYTGKIGYLITNFNLKYIKELIITLIGNFIGACSVGFILRYTRIYDNIYEKSLILANTKLNDNILSIFILSIFCGLLMYFAVNGFKKQTDFGKYLVVYLGVAVFILCGFEHCIANMYYFSVADIWSLKTLGYTGIMVLGNSIGSFIIPLCNLVIKEN
ncbi:MAG: formate/nitrite transporter family protein [Firmicutes bacterium]|jgi:formate/nitrite transporter|nr:formate/nitrite transporter family protein [Bacillota bacterium]